MSKHKEIFFEDDDRSIIISDLLGDVRFKFSFTSERLTITQEELSELINLLQEFKESEPNAKN